MILQLQAKVHGLGNLGVSTDTYQILSEFQLAVCSKYVRSMFAVCSQYVRKTGPDKFLYSRSYSGSRADYDDKFLYSRSYSGSRADYDDEVCEARGVVVFCFGS